MRHEASFLKDLLAGGRTFQLLQIYVIANTDYRTAIVTPGWGDFFPKVKPIGDTPLAMIPSGIWGLI